jgi:hypothetical protein
MKTLIIIMLIIQTISIIYTISTVVHIYKINKELDTILEKEINQNNEIDKIKLWQIEQFNLNQLMIKKFEELDETNVLKHINYLKSVNKIGEC